jgi:hypothetical protein
MPSDAVEILEDWLIHEEGSSPASINKPRADAIREVLAEVKQLRAKIDIRMEALRVTRS